jgi:hypothetical protein
MSLMRRTRPLAVNKCGAIAGSVLRGSGTRNHGLRLRISQEQKRGDDGAIRGAFVILDVGHNVHSHALTGLLHRTTDSEEVRGIIRKEHTGCVHVANTNNLVVEEACPDEHVAILAEVGRFDSLHRRDGFFEEGVGVVFGVREGKAEPQSFCFRPGEFTPARAREWLRERGFKPLVFVSGDGT